MCWLDFGVILIIIFFFFLGFRILAFILQNFAKNNKLVKSRALYHYYETKWWVSCVNNTWQITMFRFLPLGPEGVLSSPPPSVCPPPPALLDMAPTSTPLEVSTSNFITMIHRPGNFFPVILGWPWVKVKVTSRNECEFLWDAITFERFKLQTSYLLYTCI